MGDGGLIPRNEAPLLLNLSQNLKSKDLLREQAEELTRAWWAEQDPRPIQKFVVVRQIVERALTAGWSPSLLREAMDNVPTISARWLEGYANRHKRNSPDGLAAVRRMLESPELDA